jgi:hypothetical protein
MSIMLQANRGSRTMLTNGLFIVLVLLVLNIGFTLAQFQGDTQLTISDLSFLQLHEPNVYIVNLQDGSLAGRDVILTCSCGDQCVDLNLTFTGFESKAEKVSHLDLED